MGWDECWAEHIGRRATLSDEIDQFWKGFIDKVIEVVTHDGMVDYRNPEKIEAWIGPRGRLSN